jgi:hypothetical protein
LDQRVEGTYDKLKRGTKRLQHFIQANEGFQNFIFLSDIIRFQIQLLHHSAHPNFVRIVVYGGNDIRWTTARYLEQSVGFVPLLFRLL